jgi:hypothetical protein
VHRLSGGGVALQHRHRTPQGAGGVGLDALGRRGLADVGGRQEHPHLAALPRVEGHRQDAGDGAHGAVEGQLVRDAALIEVVGVELAGRRSAP